LRKGFVFLNDFFIFLIIPYSGGNAKQIGLLSSRNWCDNIRPFGAGATSGKENIMQPLLFGTRQRKDAVLATLQDNYLPRKPDCFHPHTIVLTKGSLSTEARRRFVHSICELYPEVDVVEMLDTTHTKVEVPATVCFNNMFAENKYWFSEN